MCASATGGPDLDARDTPPADHNGGVSRVTLRTIADRVGVSRMTVSNAFSRPDQLSAELRDRILATAAELGYAGPDPSARALARGRVGAVGVLLTDSLSYAFTDEVATRMLATIAEELGPSGYALTLLTSGAHEDFVPARDVPLDAAIVYSCEPAARSSAWLRDRQLPLVFIDQAPIEGYASVNIDDRGGARAAAQHVVDLGHRRIAVITNLDDHPSGPLPDDPGGEVTHNAAERLAGCLDVLVPAGIEPLRLNASATSEQEGHHAAQALLSLPAPERPTAVLAFSDRIAAGVIAAALDAGLAVPEDLSVVGYDDAGFAVHLRPALTTVRQDVVAKGVEASRLLLAAIAGETEVERVQLPTELVIRASTAPPAR